MIVERVGHERVATMRDDFRRDAGCQIVRDSMIRRGLADAWLIEDAGAPLGYGGVWNEHFPGRVMEFYVVQGARDRAEPIFEALLEASGATHVEAQTNLPLMAEMLSGYASNVVVEKLLFSDGGMTTSRVEVDIDGGVFRSRSGDTVPRETKDVESSAPVARHTDVGAPVVGHGVPGGLVADGLDGDWIFEVDDVVVGAGGVLTHYNPPFGDIYMAVRESYRRRGIGSYLVQELRRVCGSAGLTPAARCDPDNEASRRSLIRGGMVECGTIVAGPVR
jgi:GNAT superfamily N-acetyltransferase